MTVHGLLPLRLITRCRSGNAFIKEPGTSPPVAIVTLPPRATLVKSVDGSCAYVQLSATLDGHLSAIGSVECFAEWLSLRGNGYSKAIQMKTEYVTWAYLAIGAVYFESIFHDSLHASVELSGFSNETHPATDHFTSGGGFALGMHRRWRRRRR